MFTVLIAEDETNLRNAIAVALRNEGFKVVECYDGKNALEAFYNGHIDLVITDIMMPRLDGNALASKIRTLNKNIPILMLTALETIEDKEKGFNSGTDDYIVKPFLMKEMIMRVKALLRRYKINTELKITLKNTVLDYNALTLKIDNVPVELTKKEFLLLFKLLSQPDVLFSREQILNEIWGYESDSSDRTVDTHISRLREKTAGVDFEIVTVWGLGYKAVLK